MHCKPRVKGICLAQQCCDDLMTLHEVLAGGLGALKHTFGTSGSRGILGALTKNLTQVDLCLTVPIAET